VTVPRAGNLSSDTRAGRPGWSGSCAAGAPGHLQTEPGMQQGTRARG